MSAVQDSVLSHAVSMAKALGDETRFRIMAMLEEQELCACQIIEVFDLANSSISRHLSVLKQAGLLQSRKSGRWMYFSWAQSNSFVLQGMLNWLSESISHDPQIQKDRERIQHILEMEPEELCRIQNGKDCC